MKLEQDVMEQKKDQLEREEVGLNIKCRNVWVWKDATCDATFGLYIKSVLREQQKRCNLCYAERAFLVRYEHQKALAKSPMLGHASQSSWVMQNLHDKQLHSSRRRLHFCNPY